MRIRCHLATLTLLAACGGGGTAPVVPAKQRGIDMGVALSPRGHTTGSLEQDWLDFYSGYAPFGRLIAFHTSWRDDEASAGEIPGLVVSAYENADTFGFTPAIGLGFAHGDGSTDLSSASEPNNHTWTNAETRAEFLAMVVELVRTYHPEYLFLGNETNASYFLLHTQEEWDQWVDVFDEAYTLVKAEWPDTVVFTGFQLERLRGLGKKNGWPTDTQWQLLDDFAQVDALGFTSYPYFEYDTPADVPDDYYDAIGEHWTGPVIFTELGWLGEPNFPYTGGEQDQSDFVTRFFELSDDLDVPYALWLFLHDWDGQDSAPAFAHIGLRANDGTPRLADTTWQNAVNTHQ